VSKLKVLDLFSGIGGFSLGLDSTGGFETVAFCEIDEFCQKVLNKNFPNIPIHTDIKKLNKESLNGQHIDIICGGFPCQPYSIAGRKKSTEDDRDLWPEMFRVIQESRPTWVIGENVANFINLAFKRTKVDLESIGYVVQPFIIPACAIGAQHRRDRVWIIAHLDRANLRQQSKCELECESERLAGFNGEEKSIADTSSKRRGKGPFEDLRSKEQKECGEEYSNNVIQEFASNLSGERCERLGIAIGNESQHTRHRLSESSQFTTYIDSDGFSGKANASKKKNNKGVGQSNWWTEAAFDFGNWGADKSRVGRVIYGFSRGLDKYRRARVKALGNAIVPGIVTIIGRAIVEANEK
jgi:DNA (cytosine-5)-methyltransferase 1